MRYELFTVSVPLEDYFYDSINKKEVAEQTTNLIMQINARMKELWLFYDIDIFPSESETFEKVRQTISAQGWEYLMNLVGLCIYEPDIDYFDPEYPSIWNAKTRQFKLPQCGRYKN